MKDPPRSTRHRQGTPRPMIHQRAEALSDEQLMTRLSGPEVDSALSVLYDRYNRTVYGVGMKILGGDHSLAEELVQDVFLKVWRSSSTFNPSRASFSTWLYRVTRSAAIDLYRKRAHKVSQIPDGETHLLTARDSSGALEVLDAPHREVIELAYFGGLSQREISEQTGVPLGTVKSRTASAFKRLRGELAVADTPRSGSGCARPGRVPCGNGSPPLLRSGAIQALSSLA
jgi:RNA polymerase sigma-70 factor (ECF subfamily)